MQYSAEEIYEIGIGIEKNGKSFYRAAAETEKDKDMKKFFAELSEWEKGHQRIFEDLKSKLDKSLNPELQSDPHNDHANDLKAVSGSHIFVMNEDMAGLIARCESPDDVLRMALLFEKDSVVLYAAMKKLVPPHLGKDAIQKLIDEEIRHVAMLTEKMKSMKKA